MAGLVDQFVKHVDKAWPRWIDEFGRTVDYWPEGDSAAAVTVDVVWVEGTEDEEVSPGRYSHAHVRNASLPADPALGDALEKDGMIFDVVRVNAYAYYYATIILHERGPAAPIITQLTWDEIPGTWDSIPGTFDEAGNI